MPGLDSGPNKCLLHVLILGERVRQPQPAVCLPRSPDSAQPAGPPAGLRLSFPAHQTAAAAHSQDGSESPTALPPSQEHSPCSPKASGGACVDSQSKESPCSEAAHCLPRIPYLNCGYCGAVSAGVSCSISSSHQERGCALQGE